MSDYEHWLRLVKIIQHLVRRESLSIKELHTLFNRRVPIRTLQRDLQQLIDEPEIPVEARSGGHGREKRFFIEESFKDRFTKAALDRNEALVAKLIIRNLGVFRHTPLEKHARSFEEKFSMLIPNDRFEAVDHLMEAAAAGFSTFQLGCYDYSRKGEVILDLLEAITEQKKCRFTIARPGSGPAACMVWPLKMLQYQGCLYVYVKEDSSDAIRLWAVHQVDELKVFNERFTISDKLKQDLHNRERRALGVDLENVLKPRAVCVRFLPEAAHRVRGRLWHASQTLREGDDGSLLLALKVPLTEELVSWLLGWHNQVKIEEPAELVGMVRERAAGVVEQYRDLHS
jgi:predicted DNA-binding transcriptional regulator YafY